MKKAVVYLPAAEVYLSGGIVTAQHRRRTRERGAEPRSTIKKARRCRNAVHLSGAALRFTG
ncbi:hypothetical protein M8494_05105 [Serratia ureilytica]